MESTHVKLKPKNSGSKQLFNNPILERLSHTHIAVPLVFFSWRVLCWGIMLLPTPTLKIG